MIVPVEVSPAIEAQIREVAARYHLDPQIFASRVLREFLHVYAETGDGKTTAAMTFMEQLAISLRTNGELEIMPQKHGLTGYGKFARLGRLVNALHAERQQDRERENRETGA